MATMKLTVIQAAQKAISGIGKPASSDEIFNYIKNHNLYVFNAKDPKSILKSALRRHSKEPTIEESKTSWIINKIDKDKYYLR